MQSDYQACLEAQGLAVPMAREGCPYGNSLSKGEVMTFTVIDDGTLDTVLECDECGEMLRYSIQDFDEKENPEERVEYFMERAVAEHECPDPPEQHTPEDESVTGMYVLVTPVTNRIVIDPNIIGFSEFIESVIEARAVAEPYGFKVCRVEEV